jgi:hypothetical protein
MKIHKMYTMVNKLPIFCRKVSDDFLLKIGKKHCKSMPHVLFYTYGTGKNEE